MEEVGGGGWLRSAICVLLSLFEHFEQVVGT